MTLFLLLAIVPISLVFGCLILCIWLDDRDVDKARTRMLYLDAGARPIDTDMDCTEQAEAIRGVPM